MLSNDQAHEWMADAELGRKIAHAMNNANSKDRSAEVGNYGRVVECVHGDCQSLAVLDGYTSCEIVAVKLWQRNEPPRDVALKLIKEAANSRGYRLVKRTK